MNQGHTLQNTLLILTLAAVVVFSILLIGAVDRLRFSMEEVSARLKDMQDRPVTAVSTDTGVTDIHEPAGANAEFFAKKPDRGGRLIQAIITDTKNMNMLINNDSMVTDLWGMTTDSLAERNYIDVNKFEPQLAESWTLSADKMTYRIKLRKGVLWHDFTDPETGKQWKNVEVTAEDVKFYVDVIKDEKVDAVPLRGYLQGIQEIRVINDHEFDVVWNQPYFQSLEITLSLIPLPRHLYHAYEEPFDGAKFNEDHKRNRLIVGCGPYRFVSWDKGGRVILKRFDRYYGGRLGVMPPVETLVYEVIPHPNTRLQSLKSQDLDLDSLTPDQWVNRTGDQAFDEKTGCLRKIKYPAFAYNYIGLNQKKELFHDKKVRQALSSLIDRERIIRDVYFQLAQAVSGPFGVSTASDPQVKPYAFDVSKAKALLAEAGWKDSDGDGVLDRNGKKFSFTLMYPNVNTTYQKMLPIIKEDMAKAGVNMELLGLEWAVVVQRLEKKSFEACAMAWTTTISPDPYQLWHSSTAESEGSSNHIGFINPEADKLIAEIRTEFDPAARTKLYHQFHRLIHEEEPYLFLFAPYSLAALNKRYGNVLVTPLGVPTRPLWVPKAKQMLTPGGNGR